MDGNYSNIVLIGGSAHPKLNWEISELLGIPLTTTEIKHFADGETYVHICESVRGKDVYIIQPTCKPVNENLMELLIAIDTLKRASAGRINAIIPYYGYSRQDRKDKARVPITAKLVADLLDKAGADRVVSVDLHADQIQGFFDIPMDRLKAQPLIAEYIKSHDYDLSNMVVVAPDVGSVKRSRTMAEMLEIPMAIIDKRRPQANVSEVMNVIGEVKGKDVIMIDDMIDTAGTIVGAANALRELGAKKIIAACTHPLFNGEAPKRLTESAIDTLIVTNTVPLTPEKHISKVKVVSIAPLLCNVILRIHTGQSVSVLFEED
ncbi:MAG: ribose-phosphate pyrophosphokinase [Eubacteriaceae bacterium]|nr:ribose-phosphate pyrophosphokinase [Eubacteriaceae bacterium]